MIIKLNDDEVSTNKTPLKISKHADKKHRTKIIDKKKRATTRKNDFIFYTSSDKLDVQNLTVNFSFFDCILKKR